MAINFNTDPYWDDFEAPTAIDGLSPKEKYNRILFRPGVPLQARELTQLQTQLQHQVSSMGDHMFKEGSMIIPGGVTVSSDIDFIKLSSFNGALEDYIGVTLTNATNTNSAVVVHAVAEDDTASPGDPATLYINYVSGDGVFGVNDSLSSDELSATIGNSVDILDYNTVGKGSIVSVEDGIYYIRKHFVVVKTGTVVVSKYDVTATKDVGFFVTESIVSSGEDISLFDNAIGSPNETASGAHRLSITTRLGTQDVDATASNFVLLARLDGGRLVKQARTTDYALIEETLARRTFDESGNYTVNPFVATLQPHTFESMFTLSIEPAKAYIYGHEVELLSNTPVAINKARNTQLDTDQTLNITGGSYVDVKLTSNYDLPIVGDPIALKDSAGTFIGGATIKAIAQITAGGASESDDAYRIYIFNITGTLGGIESGSVQAGTFIGTVDVDPNKVNYSFITDSNIYRLPSDYTLTCDSVDQSDANNNGLPADYNYRYEITRNIGLIGSFNSTNTVVYTLSSSDEQFTDADSNDWLLYYTIDGDLNNIKQFARRSDFNVVLSNSSATATITISNYPSSVTNPIGLQAQLIAPIVKDSQHKTKTHKTDGSYEIETIQDGIDIDLTANWYDFSETDITTVKSIKLVTAAGTQSEELLEHFQIDNGQRHSHYGLGRIKLKATSNYTVDYNQDNSFLVEFDYFDHSGAGDFFNVDSYNNIPYDDIPSFEGINLRDAIDFRTTITLINKSPRVGSVFETDIQYYIARIDKIALDGSGDFQISEGSPSLRPSIPDDISDAMTIFHLLIPPYTHSPSDVLIKHVDNKRYTMRDIGALDKRINHLEYYTSLNLLENVARNQQVYDGTILDRFKTGFVADPFVNSAVARVSNPEYHASIDRQNGICRPTFEENNINLMTDEVNSTTRQTGDLITLNYTEVPIVSQLQSSNTINVNPFAVFNWTGTLTLSPSTDEWKEVERMPDVVINDDSQYDALLAQMERTTATGTIWNEWETNWTGSTSNTVNQRWGSTWGNGGTQDVTTVTSTGIADRSGITTEIVPSTVVHHQGDRVVEVNFIPYMRSRLVNAKVTRCRPNTTLYPFFDGIDVAAFVSTTVSIEPMDVANAALLGLAEHPAEVGNSAIPELTTDDKGELEFSFWIPNNDDLNFTTGTKDLVLVDNPDNDLALITTSATAEYAAKGLLEKKENVTVSTRVPKVVRSDASQTKNVSRSARSTSNRRQTSWSDPLAQTIKIDTDGGVFITSLDLFFISKDEVNSTPVTVQLLEVENGMPTQTLLPFGETTIAAANVNITGATNFVFDSPVFLQESREYCFVILSNCNDYNVKYGRIGERDENDNMIQAQPYGGVMFKSANASTWTPMQDSDIKFVLNRAEFDVDVSQTARLVPEITPPSKLQNNAFKVNIDMSIVEVSHSNHGLENGDRVVFTGVATIGAITDNTLNDAAGFEVSLVTDWGYKIDVGTNANGNGIGGGNDATAQGNVIWNVVYPYIQQMTLPGTSMSWSIRDLESTSGGYSQTPLTTIDINSSYTPISARKCLNAVNDVIHGTTNGGVELIGTFTSARGNLSPVIDLERCSLITVHNNINDNKHAGFVMESNPHLGTAIAKYMTKTVTLNDESNDLKVWMDCHKPTLADIEVYIKYGHQDIDDNDWVKMDGFVPYTDAQNEFIEVAFESDLDSTFTTFAVKVVFLSGNTARVPMIKNFRAVAVI